MFYAKNFPATAPVLQYSREGGKYKVETDASDLTIGGILWIKTKDGEFLLVAYESKKLKDNKKNYPIYNKEFLEILCCLQKRRCYLEGASKVFVF